MEQVLSYEDYRLVFEDDFDGPELDRTCWNVELHEPGWVNQELQSYVDDGETVRVENGKLLLRAVKRPDGDGGVSYASGRVSTQWKRDFTYGIFEARLKVPRGKGLLPAFWLMTTDEGRCAGRSTLWRCWGTRQKRTTAPSTTACPMSRSRGR